MSDNYGEFFQALDDNRGDEKPNGPAAQSRVLFWRDLVACPRAPYLVKGIIDAGALVEIFGDTQTFKSFIATDLGLHVACDWTWCNRRVRGCGVLYLAMEGGASIRNRMDAWARHHKVDLATVPFAVIVEPTNLLTSEGATQVVADAARVPTLGMIIIDTAARVMPGGKEDTEDMGRLVASCDTIRAETGAAVVVLHHIGKDHSRGSRGATVLPFATDTGLQTTKDDSTKIATLEHVRARDGETGAKFEFDLQVMELGLDDDGDPITAALVLHIDRPAADRASNRSLSKLSDKQKIALDALRRAICAHGEPAPASNHIPSSATVVSFDLWRRFYLATTSNSDDQSEDTRRKALRRSCESLQAKHVIGVHNEIVWIV